MNQVTLLVVLLIAGSLMIGAEIFAPGVLAQEAAKLGAWLVHYSTDYIFDGAKTSPYVETDEPAPLNAYGRTKLAQERETLAWLHGTVIRTAWMFWIGHTSSFVPNGPICRNASLSAIRQVPYPG